MQPTSTAKVSGVSAARVGDTFETFSLDLNPGLDAAYRRCRAVAAGEAWCAFLAGPPGNGKTHLAIAAMNEYGMDRSWFWKVPDFLEWVRTVAYGEEIGVLRTLKSYVEQPFLLVLDDLGVEKKTEWVDEQMYRVLDARYENHLPTIITTNQPIKNLDPRLLSRYAEGMVACGGEDIRRRRL